jgi:hypothetical protein
MVANTAELAAAKSGAGALARVADRWIYVFMAGLFVVTALAGFIPDSIDVLKAVKAGERPPLPPILHVHAILMASWLLLLLAQTSLVALGRSAQHRKLGLISTVLAPAIVIAMVAVVKSTWSMIASLPAGAMTPDALSALKLDLTNILLIQIRVVPFFAGLVTWALLVRSRDSETHKRSMILATVMPLPAAFDRIDWLPATLPGNPASVHLYTLLWLLPVLIYDIARRGGIHRVYWIGLALNVPFVIATHLLWGSPWWIATAPRLIGVQGW